MQKLAIDGGEKTITQFEGQDIKIGLAELREIISLWVDDEESLDNIEACIASSPWTTPWLFRYYHPKQSEVEKFEAAFRDYFGMPYALGVNSGTSALITALVALGIGPGDEVIIPAYTFFADAASVVVAKAIPIIAEVDDSLGLDPADVERKITERTRAIIAVHMTGYPADMDPIVDVAKRHNLYLIEDAAQAGGGEYKGKKLGTIGDVGCFSLGFFKTFVAGEGGVVTMRDEFLYTRAQSWHDTAACWRPDRYASERMEGELFCGEDYRMSELSAAVAVVQLAKLDARVAAWRRGKNRIREQIGDYEGLVWRRNPDPAGHDCAYTLGFFLPTTAIRDRVQEALAAEGLPLSLSGYSAHVRDWHVSAYWEHLIGKKSPTSEGCPFTCPYYDNPALQYTPDMCPQSLDLLSRYTAIGIDPGWTTEDADAVAKAANKVLTALL